MPDGEIYTAPVEDSVEGEIAFEFPGLYAEQRIEGIRLRFHGGEVVEARADTNAELLEEALATDAGARRVGEFGIGTNDGISRWFGDILYDEKIGGTGHLALVARTRSAAAATARRCTGTCSRTCAGRDRSSWTADRCSRTAAGCVRPADGYGVGGGHRVAPFLQPPVGRRLPHCSMRGDELQ
jgi:hypothetical protein